MSYLSFKIANHRKMMICVLFTYFRGGLYAFELFSDKVQMIKSDAIETVIYLVLAAIKAPIDTYIFSLFISNLRFFIMKHIEIRGSWSSSLKYWVSFISFVLFFQILTSILHTITTCFGMPALLSIRNTDGFLFFRSISLNLVTNITNLLEALSVIALVHFLCLQ